jgi:acetyltransferase-like isoleucine patch superfamily enzyme
MSSSPNVLPSGEAAGVRSRPGFRRYLATSDNWLPRLVRRCKHAVDTFSVPAPHVVVRPILLAYLAARSTIHFVLRVFFATPLFKAYCKQYGRGLRTDIYLHWVMGKGDIILGENVWLDGRISFMFAARFSDHPTLIIGDNSGIGHGSSITVAKQVTIGRNCTLSGAVIITDSSGHNTDPAARGTWSNCQAPDEDSVRPVTIGDGVWIGKRAIIAPGVRIGEGSVISAGSVVHSHVPPYSVVAGNPAKVLFRLHRPGGGEPTAPSGQSENETPTVCKVESHSTPAPVNQNGDSHPSSRR